MQMTGALLDEPTDFSLAEVAREKLTEQLAVTDPEEWAKSSAKVAQYRAYQNGTLAGGSDRSDGPVLPEGYAKQAKAIAERRIVLAGYRLADTLKAVTAA